MLVIDFYQQSFLMKKVVGTTDRFGSSRRRLASSRPSSIPRENKRCSSED